MNNEIDKNTLEAYLFANTPAYLFKKINKSEYFSILKRKEKEKLINIINSIDENDIASIALAYAALMALLYKNIPIDEIKRIDKLSYLEWNDAIIELFNKRIPGTNEFLIKMPRITTGDYNQDTLNVNFITLRGEK